MLLLWAWTHLIILKKTYGWYAWENASASWNVISFCGDWKLKCQKAYTENLRVIHVHITSANEAFQQYVRTVINLDNFIISGTVTNSQKWVYLYTPSITSEVKVPNFISNVNSALLGLQLVEEILFSVLLYLLPVPCVFIGYLTSQPATSWVD